jgi:hypothetical protein
MVIDKLCAPALLYLAYSFIQIVIDAYKGMYNLALVKVWVTIVFTIVLNIMCNRGLGIVSWMIVFIPFVLMSIIASILLFVFGLNPTTGEVLYSSDGLIPDDQSDDQADNSQTQPAQPQPAQPQPAQPQSAQPQPAASSDPPLNLPSGSIPADLQPKTQDPTGVAADYNAWSQAGNLFRNQALTDDDDTSSNPLFYGALGNSSRPTSSSSSEAYRVSNYSTPNGVFSSASLESSPSSFPSTSLRWRATKTS